MRPQTKSAGCTLLASALLWGCGAEPTMNDGAPTGDVAAGSAALSSALVPLRSWWSEADKDNVLAVSFSATGYTQFRTEGYVYSASLPQPAGTVGLYLLYDSTRRDHLTTTDSGFACTVGQMKGTYRCLGLQGWVLTEPRAGTVFLRRFWSAGRSDFHTTADPQLSTLSSYSPDYALWRHEGYVVRVPGQNDAPASAFHAGTMGGGPRGDRDVLAILAQYRDLPLRHTPDHVRALLSGPGQNARDYTREMSRQLFGWRTAGVLGPYTLPDDPDTTRDESTFRDNVDGLGTGGALLRPDEILWLSLRRPMGTGQALVFANSAGEAASQVSGGAGGIHTFGLIDANGGTLESGDSIGLKGFYRTCLRNDAGTLRSGGACASARLRVHRVDASGRVVTGRISAGTRVVLESGGRYLVDTGTGTFSATASTGATVYTLTKENIDNERFVRLMLEAAQAARFDLRNFDRNRDGTLTQAELPVLAFAAGQYPWGGGLMRHSYVYTLADGLRIDTSVMAVGEDEALSTLVHELAHVLGAQDMYGSSQLNWRSSLMGPTGGGPTSTTQVNRDAWHLDPWHKMRLGWVTPRIFSLAQPGSSELLRAPQGAPAGALEAEPIVLFDPQRYDVARRQGDFFVVEYRNQSLGGYDAQAVGVGLAVWQVRSDASGNRVLVANVADPTQMDGGCNLLGVLAGALVRGAGALWNNVTMAPTYLPNPAFPSASTGVQLSARAVATSDATGGVDWSADGLALARLDESTGSALRGAPVHLFGAFPSRNALVRLRNRATGAIYTLPTERRDNGYLLARVPTTQATGTFELYVQNGVKESNWRPLSVLP